MKITKEEKSLWNFLNIFKNIFSKTANRTIVYGVGNSLYLHTIGYAGKFVSKTSYDKLMSDYQFDNCFYELKQLPNNQFVLDAIDNPISEYELEKIISMIDELIGKSNYCCDVKKHDEFKIAKITETTGLWMADSDVKYINVFPEAEILSSQYDSLIIRSSGINEDELTTIRMFLIFSQLETVHAVQQKMDIEEVNDEQQLDELADIAEEEFEDDFDPMSM